MNKFKSKKLHVESRRFVSDATEDKKIDKEDFVLECVELYDNITKSARNSITDISLDFYNIMQGLSSNLYENKVQEMSDKMIKDFKDEKNF